VGQKVKGGWIEGIDRRRKIFYSTGQIFYPEKSHSPVIPITSLALSGV
jgi:hypothetical protein